MSNGLSWTDETIREDARLHADPVEAAEHMLRSVPEPPGWTGIVLIAAWSFIVTRVTIDDASTLWIATLVATILLSLWVPKRHWDRARRKADLRQVLSVQHAVVDLMDLIPREAQETAIERFLDRDLLSGDLYRLGGNLPSTALRDVPDGFWQTYVRLCEKRRAAREAWRREQLART